MCFLKYPVCLHFLELLQHETFRKEIVSGQCARFLDDQVLDDLAFANVKHIFLIATNLGDSALATLHEAAGKIV